MRRHHTLYRHFDRDGRLLYVGISLCSLTRLVDHKSSAWFGDIATVTFERRNGRKDALRAERAAIRQENPVHNIAHSNAKRQGLVGRFVPLPRDMVAEGFPTRIEVTESAANVLNGARQNGMVISKVLRNVAKRRPKSFVNFPSAAIRAYLTPMLTSTNRRNDRRKHILQAA